MPVALAAMEGHFESGPRAGLVLIGQPNEPLAPVHASHRPRRADTVMVNQTPRS